MDERAWSQRNEKITGEEDRETYKEKRETKRESGGKEMKTEKVDVNEKRMRNSNRERKYERG